MILRDLLFFNPFAYMAYFLIRTEQDSGSDKIVVKNSERPVKEIARSLLNAVSKLKSISPGKPVTDPAQAFSFAPYLFFAHQRLKNRVRSILRTNPDKIRMRVFPRIMMVFLFLILLVFQLIFFIDTGDFHLFLR